MEQQQQAAVLIASYPHLMRRQASQATGKRERVALMLDEWLSSGWKASAMMLGPFRSGNQTADFILLQASWRWHEFKLAVNSLASPAFGTGRKEGFGIIWADLWTLAR